MGPNHLDFKDKKSIRELVVGALEEQKAVLVKAINTLVDATTHQDARSEGKYDTRAIESSYIAGAQTERLVELETILQFAKNVPLPDFTEDTPIASGAIVTVMVDQSERYYLLLSRVGGLRLDTSPGPLMVITPESNIGEALVGCFPGDEFSVPTPGGETQGEIIAVS